MMSTLWRMLGRHSLCGVALLAGASLVQAQGQLPMIPTVPGIAPGAPTNPIQQVQEPAIKSQSSLGVPVAPAAAPAVPPAASVNEDKARIERLEQQIQELSNTLKGLQSRPVSTSPEGANTAAPTSNLSVSDVQKLVNSYLAEKEEAQSAEAAAKAKVQADLGYKVGTSMAMTANWENGVVFRTANDDFWVRMGFRFQFDDSFFHQSASLKNAAPVGIGQDQDGNYFRRVRPNWAGGFWEVGEFNVEIKLETITNGIAGMDDVWVGVKDIPLLGTARVGHFHLPHGLEADMYSSSKPMTFFEVSSANNAFYSGERTGSGLWLTNAFLDRHMTYAAAAYRPDNASNGDQFADGDYAFIGRLTFLPIYSDDGRCFLHLGGSATYRHALNGVVDFGSTAGMLDNAGGDNGYGAGVTPTVVGTSTATGVATKTPTVVTGGVLTSKLTATLAGLATAPGNASKIIDSGNMVANASSIFAPELFFNYGPFSLQSEYLFAYADGATGVAANGLNGAGAKVFGRQNLGFTGGYVQATYFLTGESRQYDTRLGRLNAEYISRPNTPFWFVRGEDGRLNYGLGAWELAVRFSRLDLNDGPIQGGVMDQWEAGVNWHLNNNLRVQFMYLHTDRYALPATAESGWLNGFGIRTQFSF